MGVVLSNEQFSDTYSQEIISRIREMSPELEEYLTTQQYLLETPIDNVTPLWLRNRLLIKVIDQLEERGIIFNLDRDAIVDDPLLVEAVLCLRSKFDEQRLYDFLVERSEFTDTLRELVTDDCLGSMVGAAADLLPLDEGWEAIQAVTEGRPGLLSSTGPFNELLERVFNRIDRLGEPPATVDGELDKISIYLEALHQRKRRIVQVATIVYATDENGASDEASEIKKGTVATYLQDFETELSRPSNVRAFLDGDQPVEKVIADLRMKYAERWKHCFEYWLRPEHRQELPSQLVMSVLVSTLYVDAPDQSHARVYVVQCFEDLMDQFGPRYPMMRDLVDKALGNIVIVEGGMNNEIK